MEGAAVLRQLVGEIQELWEAFGPYSIDQRWCLLDFANSSMEDEYCGQLIEGKSEPAEIEANKSPPSKKSKREKAREKPPTASSSTEIMEHRVWKELPEDLFEAVIARLPIATFFRFRSVCHKWNSLLTSKSFSHHCSEVPRAHPWFYTITHEHAESGAMYDPSLRKWHHPTITLLNPKMIFLPVASAGGLICFLDLGHRNFYVLNPLTRSFRELPSRSVRVWSRVAVGMILNDGKRAAAGYKIVWVGSNGDHEVYDSLANGWIRPGSGSPGSISLNFASQAVPVGGKLYFMRSEPDGVVSYDVGSGAWRQFTVPLPVNLTDQALAECSGRVLLVGLLRRNAATCVCVYELQRMTLLWKEVDRMPNVWCLEFYGRHVRMSCLGNRGLLLLSLRSTRTNRLVTYDAASGEWGKVPDCVLPHDRKRRWIACGTAFHPCPTAVA